MDFCLGESKRLFNESGHGNLSCLGCHVDFAQFWHWRLYAGYDGEFRSYPRPSSCSGTGACRSGILAVGGSAGRRNLGKRSCGVQLRRFVWHCQCKFRCRHERSSRCVGGRWLRYAECLLSDGILSVVYSLFCYFGYDTERKFKLEIYCVDRRFSIVCGMVCIFCYISGRKPVVNGGTLRRVKERRVLK